MFESSETQAAATPEKPRVPPYISRPPASMAPRAPVRPTNPSTCTPSAPPGPPAGPSAMPAKPAFLSELANRAARPGKGKGGGEVGSDKVPPRTPMMQDLFAQIKKRQCE